MRILPFMLVMATTLLAGCAAKPMIEYDRTADFSAYQVFAWQQPDYGEVDDPILDSPLLGKRVKLAVTDILAARGFRQAGDEAEADFIVTYHMAEKDRESHSGLSVGFGTGYWGRSSSVIYTAHSPHTTYQEGMLIIDVIDADSGDLVWRGWQGTRLNQENFDASRIRQTVSVILSEFPPGN